MSEARKLKGAAVPMELETIRDLRQLIPAIREHWENSEVCFGKGKHWLREGVKERALLGQALKEAKAKLKYGTWLPWLEKHFAEISIRTAERAMELANASHVTNLDSAKGLRQAYLLCGIIEQAEAPAAAAPADPEAAINGVAKRVECFSKRLSAQPVAHWSPEQRVRMAGVLRPLVELYQQLLPTPPKESF